CGTGTVTLGATASSGTISWYAAAAGGTSLGSGTSFSTPIISATTTYYVEATDGACNTGRTAVVATIHALPSINAGVDQSICDGDTYTLTATGATTYSWDNGIGAGNNINVNPSVTTAYTVTGVDANGCQNVDQILITVNSKPAVNAGTDQSICDGSSITLSGTGASTYAWDNGITDGVSFTPTSTTSYTVTGTDANGCSNTDAVTITVVPNPAIPTITASGPLVFCAGGSVTLTSSASSGNIWSTGETGNSILVTSSGTYSVTETTSGCSTSSASLNVTVNLSPTIALGTITNPSSCGGNDGSIEISGTGTGTLSWTGTTSGSSSVSLPHILTGLTAGSYDLSFDDGCASNIISASLSDPGAPATPVITTSGATVFCSGESVTLTSSASSNNTWSTGETGNSIVVSTSGSYSVSVTEFGCTATSVPVNVTVNPNPTIAIGNKVNTSACGASDASIEIIGSGVGNLSWTGNGGGSSTAITLPHIVGSLSAGTYNFTFDNGCTSNTVTTTVNDPGAPATPTITVSGTTTFCDGGNVTLTSSSATNNTWSTGETTQSITVSTSGSYDVTVTIAGCSSSSAPTVVTVNPTPVITAGTVNQTSACGNNDGSIQILGSGIGDLSWNGTETGVQSAVTLPFVLSNLKAGTYNFTFDDGCASNLLTVNITDPGAPATPTITADAATTFCDGGNVTLTSSAATGNTWSTGETTQSITVSSSGSYSVSVTENGCSSSSTSEVVTVNPLPTVNAGTDQTICLGTEITLAATGADSYSWDNAVTDNVPFTPASSATYTVVGTDANGCQNSDQLNITVHNLPTVNAGADLTVCEGESVSLNASGADSYSWDNGASNGVSFVPATSATYTVIGTDANGCQNTDQLDVVVNTIPVVDAGTDQAVCLGTSVTLTATGADSYIWDNAVNNGVSFIPTSTLVYTVTGTSANGCQNTDQVEVIVNQLPVVNGGTDRTICEGLAITLSANGADTYSWDNGVTDGVAFVPTSSNTFEVTGTDANGCQSKDQVLVTVVPKPDLTTTNTLEVCEHEQLILAASSSAPVILWFDKAVGGTELAQGSTFTTPDISTATSYYVESFANGCSSGRDTINILLNGKPQITISSTSSDCGNANGTAEASISQGTAPYTYYWSSGEQQVFSVSGLATGSYYFNVEDAKGCRAIAVTEVAPSSIDMNPVVTNPSCHGFTDGAIDLNISGLDGSLTFLWNTGKSTEGISNLKAGTYEVRVTNDAGCLVTESFVLTEPDPIVNDIFTQDPNCGINDGLIRVESTSGGTAPYQFNWSNGNFGETNDKLTFGIYGLVTRDANGCQTESTFMLSEKNGPVVEGVVVPTACNDATGSVSLDVTPADGDAVSKIEWSNGETTSSISNLEKGNYVSILTTDLGCTAVHIWNVKVASPMTQEICLVTVDSVTTTNLVVWEKAETEGIDYYNIYRESNQIDEYQLIDTVDFNNLSVFNDVVASPMVRSWRYKISAVNFCGVESELSTHHKTLHLNTFDLGPSGVMVNWDKYEGTSYSGYVLWRYTDANGWESIATLPTSILSFTDNTLFSEPGLDYMVEIILDEICTATVWRAQDFNTSRSNKQKGLFNPGQGTGHSNNSLLEFAGGQVSLNVFPNPFDQLVYLDLQGAPRVDVSIIDIHGQLIKTQSCVEGQNEIQMNNLANGIYFARAIINGQEQTIKLIKQ
ncbi:MAG: T9SS type A sorting domain-containing protein, partial [Bacteroidetes bacterium]